MKQLLTKTFFRNQNKENKIRKIEIFDFIIFNLYLLFKKKYKGIKKEIK